MYISTREELGQVPQASPVSRASAGSLSQRIQVVIQHLVSRGKVTFAMAQALLRGISEGIRDVNELTNRMFFALHPERGRRKLQREEPQFEELSKSWRDIRNAVVRPVLQALSDGHSPVAPTGTTSAPPPDRWDKTIIGKICPSGRGKCWPWAGKSKDIVDTDVPWNDPSHRNPGRYNAVLDYFNVGNSLGREVEDHKKLENDRYRRIDKRTWCNIYVHDVTRAMWANIPHWVGNSEQNANRTVRWLDSEQGRKKAWIQIDEALKDWIRRMTLATVTLPFHDSAVTQNLQVVAWRIAKSRDTDPQLLTQASYVAQKFANQGLPAVVVWENFTKYINKQGRPMRYSGHVAMIRPENSLKGKLIKRQFVPISAQAGGENWTNKLATNMTMPDVMYFVHE